MNKTIFTISLLCSLAFGSVQAAQQLQIQFSQPPLKVAQYQRPYTAVWIEDSRGKAVRNLAVWHEDEEWLKDIRRWWRKSGRYGLQEFDAVSGATRPPGEYKLTWDLTGKDGRPVAPGKYTVLLEAVREHGNRSLVKQKIRLGEGQQTFTIEPTEELGRITIVVGDK